MAHDIDPTSGGFSDSEVLTPAAADPDVGNTTGALSYLVTAYRWGCTNEHAYHVYGGADRTKALAIANAECADRGGKYGCVVWEFDEDGTNYKAIAYYGSSADKDEAEGPHHNHRIDFFERLGMFVNEAAGGKALLPDPNEPKRLIYTEVAPLPDYLQAEIARQRALMQFWESKFTAPTS